MSEVRPLAYVFARREEQKFPLSRYLPPCHPGMAEGLLRRHGLPGAPLLDPIGASPQAALELAAGQRILVNCNNPILAFLITLLAQELTPARFQAALAQLSTLRRGSERLEEHLKSLYLTHCGNCRRTVMAQYFLYRRGEKTPHARAYECPACGDGGQKPITAEDLEQLAALQRSYPLHRSRALERASTGSPDSLKLVNEVLDLYPERALYFLFTLMNKVESLSPSAEQQEAIDALLLAVLDAGHSLNPWPESADPPRSLSQPEEYVERNLWLVMESAGAEWAAACRPAALTFWPQLPPQAGVVLHRGRMRELAQKKGTLAPAAILSVIPRPYAAFWTLSAVWSAWLWGRESSAGYLGILERRRFDWAWHSAALQSAFTSAGGMLAPGSPAITLLPEPSTGLTNAVFHASSASQWRLEGLAACGEEMPLQCTWKAPAPVEASAKHNLRRILRDAMRQLLMESGEPQPYALLHTACLAALMQHGCLPHDLKELRGDLPAEANREITSLFGDEKFLRHLGSSSSDPESGLWWLAACAELPPLLADRMEEALLELLRRQERLTINAAMEALAAQFPGLPGISPQAAEAVLASYAAPIAGSAEWQLNDHDAAPKRSADIANIQRLLRQAAAKLGYTVAGENPLDFLQHAGDDTPAYRLLVADTAQVGQLARLPMPPGCQYVYLFPGSRAMLIKWKLDHNPLLAELAGANWHFLKFRTLRHLAVRPDLSRELWALLIDSDPISPEETTQLSMFNV